MRLVSLEIQDFRQFYGSQQIEFACEEAKNVTVVHGHNGSGKTALLNAFVWCLYGETTPDLEEPDRLENERTVAETPDGGTVEVKARLVYEDAGTTYVVERSRKASKTSETERLRADEPQLLIWKRRSTGDLEEVGRSNKDRQARLNRTLPHGLYPFFFFNGERVEQLARPDAFDQVEQGVKTLLDVKLFERTVEHLRKKAVPELSRELKGVSDVDMRDLLSQIEAKEKEHDRLEAEISQKDSDRVKLEREISEFESQQEAIEQLAEFARQRKDKAVALKAKEDQEREIASDLSRELSQHGYLALAGSVFDSAQESIVAARQRGEIPAKVKPQFVTDLLDRGRCICGRDLVSGEPEWNELLKWSEKTGLADLEEAISQTAALMGPLRERARDYFAAIDRFQGRLSANTTDIRTLKEEVALLDQELGDGSHGEDAQFLAARLAELRRQRLTATANLMIAKRDISTLDDDMQRLRQQRTRASAHDDRARLIKQQIDSAERIADVVQQIFELQKERVRSTLSAQISEAWEAAAIKNYRASVTDEYRLVLAKNVGGTEQPVYGPSTGERQVLALSFVASLVKAAADSARDTSEHVFGIRQGGFYPLIMDSPFGSLEEEYREKVAEWVPRLAEQVIVLVSNTQWREEAEKGMRDRIGCEYILELHTGKRDQDIDIQLQGNSHCYVRTAEDPFEQTLMRKVP